jgi:hypothetical protein
MDDVDENSVLDEGDISGIAQTPRRATFAKRTSDVGVSAIPSPSKRSSFGPGSKLPAPGKRQSFGMLRPGSAHGGGSGQLNDVKESEGTGAEYDLTETF